MSIRLFVGNLSYEVTEADLRAVFAEVGPVSVVRMPVDRETGRVRGFAFVDFNERSDGEAAIARLNQQMLKGRALAVSEAVAREDAPRAPRPAGGFGGGGGGGYGGAGGGNSPMGAPAARPAGPGAAATKNFGPDALPRNKRKPAAGRGGGGGGERGPRGPIKESNSGRSYGGGLPEDDDTNDVPFWAKDDGTTDDE